MPLKNIIIIIHFLNVVQILNFINILPKLTSVTPNSGSVQIFLFSMQNTYSDGKESIRLLNQFKIYKFDIIRQKHFSTQYNIHNKCFDCENI